MPETELSDYRRVEHDRAVLDVAEALRERTGGAATRLISREVTGAYGRRPFVDGWRIPIEFDDGRTRHVDILVSPRFPHTPPRGALVDRPEYLVWPHIEHDGVLCLLPHSTEFDRMSPGEVAIDILNRSVTMIDALIEGTIVERDLKEEFLTYWFYACDDNCKNVVVLFDASGPSRVLSAFRHGGIAYVADDLNLLRRWVGNRFGAKIASKVAKKVQPAALIWLGLPPLPSEYPRFGGDVVELVKDDDASLEVLVQAAKGSHEECLVLIGAEGRGGPGLVAMRIDRNRSNGARGSTRRRKGRVHRGFRAGHVPNKVAFERTYGRKIKVHRTQIERADAAWVHGRGQDARSRELLKKTVTVFGCGSVGSLVAEHLARSGVGKLNLVDFDTLCWANVGRHALGGAASGQKKSTKLAEALRRDYPHLSIAGFDSDIEGAVYGDVPRLTGNDLILSATGNWAAESLLNEWHWKSSFDSPVVYGWTEDHAVSGSAVVVAPRSSCLACGIGRTGEPYLRATEWPDKTEITTEPSCADHYQPYGAIELGYITAMIANTVIDELLRPSKESYRSVWFSKKVVDFGGRWSDHFREVLGGERVGSGIVNLKWGGGDCVICSHGRRARAQEDGEASSAR